MGEALLKTQFVAKSWIDIRKKLEKLEDWQNRGLDELLREAQKVYVRREDEKERRTVRMMVAAVREGTVQQQRKYPDRRTFPKTQSRELNSKTRRTGNETTGEREEPTECFYWGKKGHIKRNCRKRMTDEKMFKAE